MVLFNYATKELTAKVVYYGPGLCGKTTNLQYIHENLPDPVRGKMLSLATKTDRTLFFDFLPIDLGEIRGMKTRVQLYTVPGQVFYNETRRLVLKGADGIVFVADSQETMLGANVESFRNLEDNLKAHGMSLAEMPHVIQFNKRDLQRLSGIEELNAALNKYNAPFYESVATTGIGVQDTLKAVVKLVLLHLTRKYDPKSASSPRAERPTPVMAAASTPPQRTLSADSIAGAGRVERTDDPGSQTIPVSGVPVSELPGPDVLATPSPDRPALDDPPTRRRGGGEAHVPTLGPTADDDRMGIPLSGDSLSDSSFADEEIDGLVREVDDVRQGEPDEPDEGVWLGEPESEETSFDQLAPGETSDVGSAFSTPDSAAGASTSMDETAAVPADTKREAEIFADRPVVEGDSFEIDRGFDPDWEKPTWKEAPASGPSVPEDGEVSWAGADASDDAPEGEPVAPRQEEGETEDGVYLNEVVDDTELFQDPELDVTRLAAGEARDIVVPVELGSGQSVRRFKLSVRLRLDPVDPD